MAEPGYYKSNYRALRLREMVRWHGWSRGLRSWLIAHFMPASRKGIWMPGLWAENECPVEDLSPDFWQATKPHRADFERLGFVQCRLAKVKRLLDPMYRDFGSIFYFDPTRCYFGQLIYSRLYLRATGKEFNHIVIAFTAVLERGSFSCTNSRLSFDSANDGEVIRLDSYDVPVIYKIFQTKLQERPETPKPFANVEALRQWFDERQIKNFEDRVRRRLFVRMTESEIAAAEAEMQRHGPGNPPPPPIDRRGLTLKLMPVTLVIVLMVTLMVYRHARIQTDMPGNTSDHQGMVASSSMADDTIEYHGQQFKMSRAYTDYDDYKDDPNNLDTNDLARIEQTMESVKIPASFKDYRELVYATTDLEFPGYGQSVGPGQTDDGTKLIVDSTEIPQADKERVLVAQGQLSGSWKLVDDFIYAGSDTNDISRVRLEHRQLEYFDQKGNLFRKKGI